ncbi:MAG: hypothetical protein HY482_02880 [Candidatus Wildermuthbacteria bacterium]|nr:hypothetical protein [Candidatus Wildermuthbacteria bacterium]
MVSKLKEFVKAYHQDIILGTAALLACLFSFGAGYLAAREQFKEPLRIEQSQESL